MGGDSRVNQSSRGKFINGVLVEDIVRNELTSGFNRSARIAISQRVQFGINLIEATLNLLPIDDFPLLLFRV